MTATPTSRDAHNYAVAYLRTFLVLLVVAHHAALAYNPYAPPAPASLLAQPRLWLAFPVVDAQRGVWAGLLNGYNDTFFMALLFLVSGLFVWRDLERRGSGPFLLRRTIRLGIPFLLSVTLLAPLAYYPAYLRVAGHAGVGDYIRQWQALGFWPAGPAWFIWVLMLFDGIAALLFSMTRTRRVPETIGRFLSTHLFATLLLASAAVYIPLELIYNGAAWTAVGPFTFQTARILHYLVYFLAGVSLGAWGLERGPLTSTGVVASRWWRWLILALVLFAVATAVTIAFFTAHLTSRVWELSTDLAFSATCAASCMAFLALFLRFAPSRSPVFEPLSPNSYGIYLLHYVFVSWLLLAMVGTALPAFLKFTVVLSGAILASWLVTSAFRRIPAIAKIV